MEAAPEIGLPISTAAPVGLRVMASQAEDSGDASSLQAQLNEERKRASALQQENERLLALVGLHLDSCRSCRFWCSIVFVSAVPLAPSDWFSLPALEEGRSRLGERPPAILCSAAHSWSAAKLGVLSA